MSHYKRTLKPRVILPILVVGMLLTLAMLTFLTYDYQTQLRERLHSRAELLANTFNYAAESMDRVGEVRRMIAAMAADADIIDILVINAGDPARVIAANKGAWLNDTLTDLPHDDQRLMQQTLAARGPQFRFDRTHQTYLYAAPISLSTLGDAAYQLRDGAMLIRLDAAPSAYTERFHLFTAAGIMLATWSILLIMIYLLLQREILQPVATIAAQVDRYKRLQEMSPKPVQASVEIEFLDSTIRNTLAQQQAHLQALEQQREIARSSEERLRLITSHSGDMIFRCDSRGVIDFISPACETILGRTADALINTSLLALIHPDDRPAFEAQLRTMLQSGRFGVMTCRTCRIDGTPIWLETSLQPLITRQGGPLQLIGVARDITERKRVETLKSEFISTVSHELRTPLTSISGALGLAVGGVLGDLPPKAREMLELAQKNSQQLKRLIDDLLDMEKLVAGKMSLQLQPYSVQELVTQAVDANRAYGIDRGIRIAVVSDSPDEKICVDQHRFAQILSNLLSNAVKYSPDNDTVIVRIMRHNGCARVSVEDNGPGVPDDFKTRIFEKFSQADSSDTRKKGGTGLGLAICRELTLHMQGHIDYLSTPGTGTCFYVEFPVVL